MEWARAGGCQLARFGSIDGAEWDGQVFCGHGTRLYARRVDDFSIQRDAYGKEKATWKEKTTRSIQSKLQPLG